MVCKKMASQSWASGNDDGDRSGDGGGFLFNFFFSILHETKISHCFCSIFVYATFGNTWYEIWITYWYLRFVHDEISWCFSENCHGTLTSIVIEMFYARHTRAQCKCNYQFGRTRGEFIMFSNVLKKITYTHKQLF